MILYNTPEDFLYRLKNTVAFSIRCMALICHQSHKLGEASNNVLGGDSLPASHDESLTGII